MPSLPLAQLLLASSADPVVALLTAEDGLRRLEAHRAAGGWRRPGAVVPRLFVVVHADLVTCPVPGERVSQQVQLFYLQKNKKQVHVAAAAVITYLISAKTPTHLFAEYADLHLRPVLRPVPQLPQLRLHPRGGLRAPPPLLRRRPPVSLRQVPLLPPGLLQPPLQIADQAFALLLPVGLTLPPVLPDRKWKNNIEHLA